MERIDLPGHRLATHLLADEEVDEMVDWIQYGIEKGFSVGDHPGQVPPHGDTDGERDQ
jgi:hypothetical protein